MQEPTESVDIPVSVTLGNRTNRSTQHSVGSGHQANGSLTRSGSVARSWLHTDVSSITGLSRGATLTPATRSTHLPPPDTNLLASPSHAQSLPHPQQALPSRTSQPHQPHSSSLQSNTDSAPVAHNYPGRSFDEERTEVDTVPPLVSRDHAHTASASNCNANRFLSKTSALSDSFRVLVNEFSYDVHHDPSCEDILQAASGTNDPPKPARQNGWPSGWSQSAATIFSRSSLDRPPNSSRRSVDVRTSLSRRSNDSGYRDGGSWGGDGEGSIPRQSGVFGGTARSVLSQNLQGQGACTGSTYPPVQAPPYVAEESPVPRRTKAERSDSASSDGCAEYTFTNLQGFKAGSSCSTESDGEGDLLGPLLGPAPGGAKVTDHEEADSWNPGPPQNELAISMMSAIVNILVSLPVSIAFTSIVFRSSIYVSYVPKLARLVILANGIHQLIFVLVSTLPFAVGQVQDVGLIFLSAMTTSIAHLAGSDVSKEVILSTALVAVSTSTALVGLLLIFIGKMRLASLVSYIPLPVIAGYLGYVGYFCLAAGASQGTGQNVTTLITWLRIFSFDTLLKTAASVVSTSVVFFGLRYWRSPAAMPVVLLTIPVLYYLCMGFYIAIGGCTWAEMQTSLGDNGWVTVPDTGSALVPFWDVYQLYDLRLLYSSSSIAWPILLRQVPTLVALFFVVSFGSSMDIMAIQTQLPYDVDADRELVTVGVGNLVSGLMGAGATGSYIFSQTLFGLRAGVTTRTQGWIISSGQIILFLLPFPLVQYLPNFFYGALVMTFGLEIIIDWMISSYSRVTQAEFVLAWISFGAIMTLTAFMPVQGLEAGILVGILACGMHFAFAYSSMQLKAFTLVPPRSNSVLPFHHRQVLELFQTNMIAVTLNGYIFFGSAVDINKRVRSMATLLYDAESIKNVAEVTSSFESTKDDSSDVHTSALAAVAEARKFLLLDFRQVSGLDASAASSFAALRNSLASQGVVMVITGLCRETAQTHIWRLMCAHQIVSPDGQWEDDSCCPAFDSVEAALEWCEAHFLQIAYAHGLCEPIQQRLDLLDVMEMHLHGSMNLLPPDEDLPQAVGRLRAFLSAVNLSQDETLFRRGDSADAIYIVTQGTVTCVTDYMNCSRQVRHLMADPINTSLDASTPSSDLIMKGKHRLNRYSAGGVFGDMDFLLSRPRSFDAYAASESSTFVLTRTEFDRMARTEPHLMVLLQHIVLQSNLMTASNALQALERARL